MKKTLAYLFGALALFGCGGGGGGNGSSSDARVAYVNASPDAGDLAFSLNDTRKASGLGLGEVSSFGKVGDGSYDVSIGTEGDPETIASEQETFGQNTDSLVLALGLRTTTDDEREKRLQIAVGSVDREALTGNRARIVLVNALVRATDQDSTPVDFRNPVTSPAISAASIGYGEVRSIDIDSGTQSFEARQTGTEGALIASTPLTFAAGRVYLVLISGREGATDATIAPSFRVVELPTR